MGKDRRKEKAEEDVALGKKADKYGKKGDGKKKEEPGQKEKSFTHQTVRHILVQKMALQRLPLELHRVSRRLSTLAGLQGKWSVLRRRT